MPFAVLWPTFALVLLIFTVLTVLAVQRFDHIRRNPPRDADLADNESVQRYFRSIERASNNLKNLFEMPVLYFALVPLLLITHHGNHLQAVLAWIFVVLRWLHSAIHVTTRGIPPRTMVYLLSCLVLLAMWIIFFVAILHAASLYHHALGGTYPMG